MTDYARDPNDLVDLPGMWDASDFIGGDPDERSYAERGWDPADKASAWQLPDLRPYMERMDRDINDLANLLWTPLSTEVEVAWGDPQPRTVAAFAAIDPEVLELVFGQPVIPLCQREIPAEGTE